ncbi:inactive TPR repeat-containing thioredoxin TTL3 isoform X1 [Ziziphus jujuba]|uniref:Inactive TPR repeat-containing thioredoxin TTL3 isoform X1 n=1 Tax=Ziziphus jujuba TaxID=326968 RepID=A0ABM3IH33_ZIZJJ|nr:inactive TPR repeat-containing thioredoxin TTL3 isoform X1 [Ziziphus jujuba]
MSETGKSIQEMGFDSLTDRFRNTLSCSNNSNNNNNKPDFKELDLGSPVSPLITRPSGNGGGAGGGGAGGGAAVSSSSSSSSTGSVTGKTSNAQLGRRSDGKANSHSGELSGSSETSPTASESHRSTATKGNSKPGHRRLGSAGTPLIYSGGSFSTSSSPNNGGGGGSSGNTATSFSSNSTANLFPSGNICPSGKILKASIPCKTASKTVVLGSGTGNYGHGSIMRGGAKLGSPGEVNVSGNIQSGGEALLVKRAMANSDPEEVKKAGNELYKRGHFVEALSLYDRAISIMPDNAAYRSNRAAVLTALGRLGEAVRECEEAVRLDPGYGRAHQRLASLYLRFGQVENARRHLYFPGQQPDQSELQKLRSLEKHLKQCADARKLGDWKSVVRESDAALATGVDSSPQIVSCKAEALLKLHQLEESEFSLSNMPKLEDCPPSCLQTVFFGMLVEAYVLCVRAQIEMALGRFENAVAAIERASLIDYSNVEITRVLSNVKMVARARSRGNDLFSCGRYSEACSAYGEGLKYDGSNSVLYCNRAVCWSKLGLWEQSVEDCNQALKIQPNYIKALLRRAVSNAKLERWAEAVRDYEVLRRELPGDNEVAESLQRAQVALKKSYGEDVHHSMKFGGEVEEISSLDKFKAAACSLGVSVFHFKVASNEQCEEISPFINMLCVRYPSIKFFKVDVEESLAIAKAESIRMVPTFKIYRNGVKVKELIRPNHQFLEESVRNCSL